MKRRVAVAMLMVAIGMALTGCFFNVTSYQDSDGSTVYVGEVKNDGAPLGDPVITATLKDMSGNVIGTQTTRACRPMPTGSVAAFKLTLPKGTTAPASVDWELGGTPVANPYLADGLTGHLIGDGPAIPGSKPSHYGEMKNESANTYYGGYACVAWVDAQGRVLRESETQAAGARFAPGDTLPFDAKEDVPADAAGALVFLDAGVDPAGSPAYDFADEPLSSFTHVGRIAGPGAPWGFQFGEFHNPSASKVAVPRIAATTHDAAGQLNGVGDSNGLCNVPAPPGGMTYTGFGFTSAAPAGTLPALRIEALLVDPADAYTSLPVSALTKSGTTTVTVSGTVKNTSSSTMAGIVVCAAAYDASGAVISVLPGRASVPSSGLAPGADASFAVDLPVFSPVAKVNAIAAGSTH